MYSRSGQVFQDFGMGGIRYPDLWHILQGGRPGDPLVRIRDLGDNPQNHADPRKLRPQGGPPLVRDATTSLYRGAVVVLTFGGGDGGSGTRSGILMLSRAITTYPNTFRLVQYWSCV